MRISVVTPSFNKVEYVGDAINSVLRQTFQDFEYIILENSTDAGTRAFVKDNFAHKERVKYIEIDFTEEERKEKYPTAVLLNKYYPLAEGEFIFYLSDDDIIYDDCFEKLMEHFEKHPNHNVAYFSQESHKIAHGKWEPTSEIVASETRGKDTGRGLNCQIDGGQIIHRKSCLDSLKQPFFDFRWDGFAACCDGKFMEKLGEHYIFHPVPEFLGTHRVTPKSVFNKG